MTPTLAPPAKQYKRSTALIEDDLEATEAVTHEKVTKITRLGATKIKNVLVSLLPVIEQKENVFRGPDHHNDQMGSGEYHETPSHEHDLPLKTSKIEPFQNAIVNILKRRFN